MLNLYFRPAIKKLLLKLLKWNEKVPAASAVRRGGGQKFWQKEIYLPPLLVTVISAGVFLGLLLFEVEIIFLNVIGLVIFLSMVFIFLFLYLRYEQPEIIRDGESVMLLGFIFISALLVMQLSTKWFSPIAAPIAAFTILTGLLLSRDLAIVVGVILSLMIGMLNGFSFDYFLIHFFSSLTGVIFLHKIRNRSSLTRLGIKLIITNVLVILIIYFNRNQTLHVLESNVIWGVLSGFSSILIVLGTLPYLEALFSRTTNIKLVELGDFNQPILKRLMLEAPGTYHHSLIMASLAEQAAEAIGANSLLARVGAYYHDIGKLSNPGYFIENQQQQLNPHDPIAPTMSSLVVISHVKEGKVLAAKGRLDKVIIDCIEQHHGTSLIHYFYHKALEQNSGIASEDFRYSGPKPKSKETAILMIADAVEAASRVVEDPTPGRLKDTVEKVMNNKFTDGQFSECPITLHDLHNIAESMVNTLSGIYHARIEYQNTDAN